MRALRRNKKGLAPIFAVLILIAIAVIAGIIVYMFTSGYIATMTGGGQAGQEKVAVETVVVTDTASATVTVWAKSTGGGPVIIDGAILKRSTGETLDVDATASQTLTSDGALLSVACDFADASMVVGDWYTVTLTSAGGGKFVSETLKCPDVTAGP